MVQNGRVLARLEARTYGKLPQKEGQRIRFYTLRASLLELVKVFFAIFSVTKRSLELISFSQGPINFGRKTKKYVSKKVDLAAEIFSFQDFDKKRVFTYGDEPTSEPLESGNTPFSETTGS